MNCSLLRLTYRLNNSRSDPTIVGQIHLFSVCRDKKVHVFIPVVGFITFLVLTKVVGFYCVARYLVKVLLCREA